MPYHLLSILTISLLSCGACSRNDSPSNGPADITTRVLTDNLQYPWEILWGPDNFIWMTERGGKISRVNPATGAVTPVLTIAEVVSRGEGGMLGLALHPDFNTTPHVFVAYNYDNGGYKEKIVRYTYSNNSLINPVILIDNIAAAGIHNGCRLLITANQKLFITTGDASNGANAQNINSPNGKILRINLDGSIPADNPIAGNPLWSMGLRNAQGLVYANNIMYSSEHGPDSDDEINIIEKNRNYGWPTVKGFCDAGAEQAFCTGNQVKEPLKAWTPTVAVCGLDFYNHDLISQWKNSLLLCTLKGSRLIQLKLNDAHNAITSSEEFFRNTYGRLRDICISPEGKVYLCTSNGDDKIVVVEKK